MVYSMVAVVGVVVVDQLCREPFSYPELWYAVWVPSNTCPAFLATVDEALLNDLAVVECNAASHGR